MIGISVVIAARNAEKTIERSLSSLQAQTHTLWEVIVVDDGSTDGTSSVVERIQRRDARIRLSRQNPSGLSAARNSGIAMAMNAWLLFLDADGTILPAHLERLTSHIYDDPSQDAVYCAWRDIYPFGGTVDHYPQFAPDLFPHFCRFCVFAIHTCLVRRSLVEQCGAFDVALPFCEDWDLWQRIARTGARFGYVPEILAEYWLHADQDAAAKFLRYGIPVIERGHGPDSRLPQPSPRYAAGCNSHDAAAAVNCFACWAAGLLLGNDGNCNPAIAVMRSAPGGIDPDNVAGFLFYAVLRARLVAAGEWRQMWPSLMMPICRFLLRMEWRSECPRLAARTMSILQTKIASVCAAAGPIHVGRVFAQSIDARRPFEPVTLSGRCDRILFLVRFGDAPPGNVELPATAGNVGRYLVSDAIATDMAWVVLGAYFGTAIYPYISSRKAGNSVSFFRGATLLARAPEIPTGSGLHDLIGWTILLQEVFGRPSWKQQDFYNPTVPEPLFAQPIRAVGRLTVEIGENLLDVICDEPQLEVECRIGGVPVVLIGVDRKGPVIRGSEIRVGLLAGLGSEICRAVVREALLFRTSTAPDTLRARLAKASLEQNEVRTRDRKPAVSRDLLEEAPRYLIEPRNDASINPTVFRRFVLPDPPESFIRAERDRGIVVEVCDSRYPTDAVRCPELLSAKVRRYPVQGRWERLSRHTFIRSWLEHRRLKAGGADRAAPVRSHDAHWFDAHFARAEDPWGYTNAYEKRKYEQTLSLLPATAVGKALELGCAEGHFTAELAPRVQHLTAADISSIALKRAAARCDHLPNIEFRQLELGKDAIPGQFDLIVCSEVLYFVGKRALADVAATIAGALAPGGALVMAHGNVIQDEPKMTGFAWDLEFGAARIGRVFAEIDSLSFISELRTPLYRIQHFRKATGRRTAKPRIIHERYAEPLPERLQVMVRNGGQHSTLPAKLKPVETSRLPVLMYHRIGNPASPLDAPYCLRPEYFEAQIKYLAGAGFYSVSLDDWGRATEVKKPLPGRAVLITFDDGCLDFAVDAWPILQRYGFSAHMFVVTAAIGKTSHWDPPGFPRVPLLSWSDIEALHKSGVRFGSHTVTHAALDACSQREAVRELTLSRIQLEERLGEAVTAVAFPFGAENGVCRHLAGGAGYSYGLTTRSGRASLHVDLLGMPRLAAPSGGDLSRFLALLED